MTFNHPDISMLCLDYELIYTVHFDSYDIYVDTTGGIPYIEITLDGDKKVKAEYDAYMSGYGNSLAFVYKVKSGDFDSDGIENGSSIVLNGGIIRGGFDYVPITDTTLYNMEDRTFYINGVRQSVYSVKLPDNKSYKAGDKLQFIVKLTTDRLYTSASTSYIEINIGGRIVQATATFSNPTNTYQLVYTYTVQPGDMDPDGIVLGSSIIGGYICHAYYSETLDPIERDITRALYGKSTAGIKIDTQPPSVPVCTLPANGTYKAGRNLDFNVEYDEPVNVNTQGGIPYINVPFDGGIEKKAEYAEGSGTNKLIFRYVVELGDADAGGIGVDSSITTGGALLYDAAGNPAPLTTNFSGSTEGILVNGSDPLHFSILPETGDYIIGDTLEFSIKCDQALVVDMSGGVPYIELTLGGSKIVKAFYTGGSGTDELLFSYTVEEDIGDFTGVTLNRLILLNGGNITYSAGGLAALMVVDLPDAAGIKIESNRPQVLSVTVPLNGSYDSGKELLFTVNYDKVVNVGLGGAVPYIDLFINSAAEAHAEYSGGTGSTQLTFSYVVKDSDVDADGIALGTGIEAAGSTLTSIVGNNADLGLNGVGSMSYVRLIGKIPEVVSVSVGEDKVYKEYDTIVLTVHFNEPVNVTTDAPMFGTYINLTIESPYMYGTEAYYTAGSGTADLTFQYEIESYMDLEDFDGIGIGNTIVLYYGSSIKDSDGNNANLVLKNLPDTTGIKVDTVGPDLNANVQVPVNGYYKAGNALDFIVSFTEAVYLKPSASLPYLQFWLDWSKYMKAEYVDGLGTNTLRFRYIIKEGDIVSDEISFNNAYGFYNLTDSVGHPFDGYLYGRMPALGGIIIDTKRPGVTSVAVPSNGTYKTGAEMLFKINFDEPVFVDISGTLPAIEILMESGESASAVYTGGTGTQELLFTYTVKAGDSDINGIVLGNTVLNAAVIRDIAGNSMAAALNSVAGSGGVLVDGIKPAVEAVTIDAIGVYGVGDILKFKVKLDEPVNVDTGAGIPSLPFTTGENTLDAGYSAGSGSNELEFDYMVKNGDNSDGTITIASEFMLNGGIVSDLAGNNTGLSINGTREIPVRIDTKGPEILSASLDPLCRYLDITFNEGVYGADDGSAGLSSDKLRLVFVANGGRVSEVTISSIKQNNSPYEASSSELKGGEAVVRVFLDMPVRPSGVETIEILPLNNTSLFDRTGNPAEETQTTGKIKLIYIRPSSESADPPSQAVNEGFYVSTNQTVNGQTTNNIAVDTGRLQNVLSGMGVGTSNLQITAAEEADVIHVNLDGQAMSALASKDVVLEVGNTYVRYALPVSNLNADQVFQRLGENISISISIANASENTTRVIEDTVNRNNYQLVVKPLEFIITCDNGEETIQLSRFPCYVERFVAIPDTVDPATVTTGVVLNEDGTLSHIPTTIVEINGRYYARLSSMTNSVYTIIINAVKLKDMEGHWAEDDVNDLVSRLIINSEFANNFLPEKRITRAEFAAFLVNGLGCERTGSGKGIFSDVSSDKWYYDAVEAAYDYGIVKGIGNGKFNPEGNLTRIEAMIMIYHAISLTDYKINLSENDIIKMTESYSDADEVLQYSQEAAVCISEGIIMGYSGEIHGKDSLTRAQAAAVVRRMLKKTGLID